MTSPLTHRRAQHLLAPYALDALDADERHAVEQHLAECRACTAEVDANHETLARLTGEGEAPPAAVWDRIAASLPPAPAVDEKPSAVVPIAQGRRRPPVFLAAAAVTVLLVGLAGVRGLQVQRRLDDIRQSPASAVAEAAAVARRSPEARLFSLNHTDGTPAADAIVLPDGTGYLESRGLAPLAEGQGYQLWAMAAGTPISIALLGSRPTTSAFRLPQGAAALAVSVETQGGSVAPTGQPIAVGRLPAAR